MPLQPEQIRERNSKPVVPGKIGLYWMQAAQRAHWNHALEHAIGLANAHGLPLVVLFCLVDDFPEANLRHYRFMLEGLAETRKDLEKKGIRLVVRLGTPQKLVPELAAKAAWVVTDAGHLRIQRVWRQEVAAKLNCRMVEVETNCVVPVEAASDKENFSAGTLRPRIQRQLPRFLVPLRQQRVRHPSLSLRAKSLDLTSVDRILQDLNLDRSVPPVAGAPGGPSAARKKLKSFLREKLDHFHDLRNDPTLDYTSGLSPYLHFGQISPLYVALEASKKGEGPGLDAFLEELIVRRELAQNFTHYNPQYDQYEGLANWAKATLEQHAGDPREYLYSLEEFEQARTHDPYWNAAQLELVHAGTMHGYMRMYWGKKILEWTADPLEGFDIALYLNNKYQLDGRDPNGFAGVAWCFGQHDRAWGERPVYGKVRYMNANGLRRKFKIERYVERITGELEG
jgi:deoxyribodipyrimidine photo-lyase